MHNIQFRGKRTDNGEWVYGYYVRLYSAMKDQYGHRIYTGLAEVDFGECLLEYYEVDPTTVGQFTGLEENGVKIFVGDILRGHNCLHESRTIYEVAFDDGMFALIDEDGVAWHYSHMDNREVIGNIFDNPELLRSERSG